MSAVKNLRNLTWFNFAETKVTDAGVSALASHPSIRTISLEGTRVSNASLAVLATMPQLKSVWSSPRQFTGTALSEFKKRRPDVRIEVVEGTATGNGQVPDDPSSGQIPVDAIGR